MSYKIAVASSNQVNIDLNFGGAFEFLIYEAQEDGEYHLAEIRSTNTSSEDTKTKEESGCQSVCKNEGCKSSSGCGDSHANHPNVLLLDDCRCILCKKVGFQIRKQLDKKAITIFEIDGGIGDSLHKITAYFHRVDNHQTLRGIANQNGKEIADVIYKNTGNICE